MEWIDVLKGFGMFLGGGFLTFLGFVYNAKPKKNSIEIENMKIVIDELQDVIKQNSENSKSYREEVSKEISELKKEVRDLSLRVDIKHEAIYSSSRCALIKSTEDCVVMQTFKKRCEDCGINKN